jgi:hypothetical protein
MPYIRLGGWKALKLEGRFKLAGIMTFPPAFSPFNIQASRLTILVIYFHGYFLPIPIEPAWIENTHFPSMMT